MRGKGWQPFVIAGFLVFAAPVVSAGEFNPLGDGSQFDNPDLIRGAASSCAECISGAPYEWQDGPAELDWSIGLRGAVSHADDGTSFSTVIAPAATITHETLRGAYSLGAEAELTSEAGGATRIDTITLNGTVDHRFDDITTASLRGSISASQDDPDGPGYASNVSETPLMVSGEAEGSVSRDFGSFSATLRGDLGRSTFGDTVYEDGTSASSDFQNNSWAGLGGRLALPLGPALLAFGDFQADHSVYEQPSPSLLLALDNTTYALRAGLNATPDERLELEGSIGYGYRDFVEAGLGDFSAVLYDAKAIYRPHDTVEFSGIFSTILSAPGTTSGARGKITYELTGEASYRVNPWLKLRSSAGWSEAHYAGIDNDEYGWSAGLGADYLLNEHTDATLDYVFSRSQTTPDPAEDEQSLMMGITLHR